MTKNPTTFVIFSGDSLLAELLAVQLSSSIGREVGTGSVQLFRELSFTPTHVILDFRSSEELGMDFVREILLRFSEARCLILSNSFPESLIRQFRRMRVAGLVDKNAGLSVLKEAVSVFASGGFYLSPGLDKLWTAEPTSSSRELTSREVEILTLVAKGLKSPEISSRLGLSVKTVHNHRANMMRRVGVRNVAQLVNYAHQNFLVRSA